MELEHRNHDDAIDKTLAALKTAAPPDGMESRILQRLQQPAPAAPLRWRDLFAGSALAAAWWRGALSGAATAMLIVAALLLAQHALRTKQPAVSQLAAARNLVPAVLPVAASAPNSPARATPCPTPSLLHVTRAVPESRCAGILPVLAHSRTVLCATRRYCAAS